ncbi:hypothetical protein J3Q64DRAFT_1824799 [Phycomyces blakesleeanus]|uniref:DH domain-containing protein n=2 Tax=Phycomyces blakesleeanus TaxID=4837 RepID=A0ABR3AQ87_PHYBL
MVELKTTRSNLKQLGYTHSWKLIKEHDVTKELAEFEQEANSRIQPESTKMPLCQTLDLIVPEKERSHDQERQLQQFLTIVGSSFGDENMGSIDGGYDSDSIDISSKLIKDSSVPLDKELRECRINEFIDTEQSYVDSLKTLVDIVLKPLKTTTPHTNTQPILNQFKLAKIFLNIESVLTANQKFLSDLELWQANPSQLSFGFICANHMANFECYRKYLMDQKEAQKLHVKEVRSNQRYKKFLTTAKEHPGFRRRSLQDILVEPVQRIGRYTMMLKEILKHTDSETKECEDLTNACSISSRIATMKDDVPTKLATMSLSLYTSIKDSPCSLISQHRSLVAHLDAVEIHRDTNKPFRSVTFFLFTDKLLVATRPSHLKGSDLCHVLKDEELSTSKSAGHRSSDKATRKDGSLKFKAWLDIGQVELFEGVHDLQGSFLLRPLSPQSKDNAPFSTLPSLEAYFYKGARLYTPISPKDHNLTPETTKALIQRKNDFLTACQRTQAISKSCHEQRIAYECTWTDRSIYTTLHDPDSYNSTNRMVVVYVDCDDVLETGFLSKNTGSEPLIVALVQADVRGFRFHVSSRLHLSPIHKKSSSKTDQNVNEKRKEGKPSDFESVFWNNLLLCEQRLRYSSESFDTQEPLTDDENQKLVRSRSFTRPNSILGLRKLLSYGDIRSRASSPLPSATATIAAITSISISTSTSTGIPAATATTMSGQSGTKQHGLEIQGAKTNNREHNQGIQEPPSIISRSLPSRTPSMSIIDSHFCDTESYGRSLSTSSPLTAPSSQYPAPSETSNYSLNTWSTSETKVSLDSYSPNPESYSESNQCYRDTNSAKQDDLLSFLLQKHHQSDKNFISTETDHWPTYHYADTNTTTTDTNKSSNKNSIDSSTVLLENSPSYTFPSSVSATVSSPSTTTSYRSNTPGLFNTFSSNSSGQSVKSSIDLEDEGHDNDYYYYEEGYQAICESASPMPGFNSIGLKDNNSNISRKVQELISNSRSCFRSVLPPGPGSIQPLQMDFEPGNNPFQATSRAVPAFGQETVNQMDGLLDKQNLLKTHVDRLGKLHPEVENELNVLKDIHKQVFDEMDLLLNLIQQAQLKMPRETALDIRIQAGDYTAERLDSNKKSHGTQSNDTLLKHAQAQRDYWEHHASELSLQLEN